MKPWLVGCEESGAVRDALLARGVAAVSCDLRPSRSDRGEHLQCDLIEALGMRPWRGLIAFPDCTYLTCAAEWAYKEPDFNRYPGGGYHQRLKPGTLFGEARCQARKDAASFFLKLWQCALPMVALENPSGRVRAETGLAPTQTIQPFHFGDDASKRTCLWVRGMPPLRRPPREEWFPPRTVNGKNRWGNQTDGGQNRLSPGPDRARDRSKTWPGIADAMADQWGALG